MIQWGLLFLLIAVVAGIFGFSRIAGTASFVSKSIFGVAIILLLLGVILANTLI